MTTVLNSYTLADPSEFTVVAGYRGASFRMANGAVKFDTVVAGAKREFLLSWQNISDADKEEIITAYLTATGSGVSFTDPEGDSWTVTMADDMAPIEWRATKAAAGLRYSGSIRLREV